jgi:hypothetical protein
VPDTAPDTNDGSLTVPKVHAAAAHNQAEAMNPARKQTAQERHICAPRPPNTSNRTRAPNGGYLRAQVVFHQGSVNGSLADPSCMNIHERLAPETYYFAADRGDLWLLVRSVTAARVEQHVFASQVLANCGRQCVFCG